ncbi:hypothetical protein XAC3810_430030 [Xanthomonas citri pv. citri]|uniref:Uncharacterized protein n=1 Tax=Xanthomonas citri pv. citri TaxID=611301 RepID=A0A0U5G9L8_XANCI|nr:hypothetical protein XAC3824_480005 [Xanthomonas citri pv. citri]CEE27074.1 hypothetical protein XAC9322_430053 [Xanthomonas citri pv. citri]CEE28633.1 hypothetical protein XAC1083_430055 [Xanthomonas citri pv. citri]CEE37747.1 hypothetical protein XAC3810_430030 [Xanthomonas citri pv. citri]CEE40645.1 hypothetical protein XAC2911_410014 [Xanthomonas citri pv. citri]
MHMRWGEVGRLFVFEQCAIPAAAAQRRMSLETNASFARPVRAQKKRYPDESCNTYRAVLPDGHPPGHGVHPQ